MCRDLDFGEKLADNNQESDPQYEQTLQPNLFSAFRIAHLS